MAVNGGHLDPILTERADKRFHFVSGNDEVAGDRRFAAAGRLEVDHGAGSHGGWEWHAILDDRVLAGNGELIDTAIDLTIYANRTVQVSRVEVNRCCLGGRRSRRTKGRLALAKHVSDGACQHDIITMPMNVHVVDGRVGAQHVLMKRGDV